MFTRFCTTQVRKFCRDNPTKFVLLEGLYSRKLLEPQSRANLSRARKKSIVCFKGEDSAYRRRRRRSLRRLSGERTRYESVRTVYYPEVSSQSRKDLNSKAVKAGE
ncbi:hypothetical protein Rs2_35385 [Raphanus sativus]|nr:hypothetical protein Rs2_35385 [Raphanus sativus]